MINVVKKTLWLHYYCMQHVVFILYLTFLKLAFLLSLQTNKNEETKMTFALFIHKDKAN